MNTNNLSGQPNELEVGEALAEELLLVRTEADLVNYYRDTIAQEVPGSEQKAKEIFAFLTQRLKQYFEFDFVRLKQYNEDPEMIRFAVLNAYHQLLRRKYDQRLIELMFAGMGFELRHDEGKQTLTGVRHVEGNTELPLIVQGGDSMALYWNESIKPLAPNSYQLVVGLWDQVINNPPYLRKYYPQMKDNPSTFFSDVFKAYADVARRIGDEAAAVFLKGIGFEMTFENPKKPVRIRHILSGRVFEYNYDKREGFEVQPAKVVGGMTGQVHGQAAKLIDPKK